MIEVLDRIYFAVKWKAEEFVRELKEDESGVSAFVATILLILIVVLLCAFFWEQISTWMKTTWSTITQNSDTIKPM